MIKATSIAAALSGAGIRKPMINRACYMSQRTFFDDRLSHARALRWECSSSTNGLTGH